MFYTVEGIWNHKIQKYISTIQCFRFPDVYCSKGLFKKEDNFKKKEGKKAFTL